MTTAKMNHLLYEIGIEEIPSGYIENAVQSASQTFQSLMTACGYQSDSIEVHATPRRFVVFASNLQKLGSQFEERVGLSREQAYRDGKPTPALEGFLRSVGKKETDINWKETPRGVRACVEIRKEVKPLKHLFETLPNSLEFPKLMRWDASHLRFTRPIRWTFALVGRQVQKYKIGLVASGHDTYGHRFLSNRKIRVLSADLTAYEKLLRRNHVVLRQEARIAQIKKLIQSSHNHDQTLIEKVANLVEEPFLVKGTFDQAYLKLPHEVLSTAMRHHQQIFACYDKQGRLQNKFFAIINGKRQATQVIAKNYENVLVSRLEDARFFYKEDLKTKLEKKVEKLKELIFLGKLGSYHDKMIRVRKLAAFLAGHAEKSGLLKSHQVSEKELIHLTDRTALLSKADLMTHLVYEFPELQGVAGAEYAKYDGEKKEVYQAISQHYLPLSLSENYETLKARMNLPAFFVSLSDRFDLLAGALGMGIEISGSRDPYALRRASGGLAKLIRAFKLSFSISETIRFAFKQYGHPFKVHETEIQKKVSELLKERTGFELQLKSGTKSYEIFQAVYASASDDLADVYARYEALKSAYEKNQEEFLKACKVIERTGNILKGVEGTVKGQVNPTIFEHEAEKALYQLVCHEEPVFSQLVSAKQYDTITTQYSRKFYAPLHRFFDEVLVNVEDHEIRSNRQALVKKVNAIFTDKMADLALVTNQ